MAATPRLLTIDPTGAVARLTRAALELTDSSVIQVDAPGSAEALAELERAAFQVVVVAQTLDDERDGLSLVADIITAELPTRCIVIAEADDHDDVDLDRISAAGVAYLRRPLDAQQMVRVLLAGLDGRDVVAAAAPPMRRIESEHDYGAVPRLDVNFANQTLDTLLSAVGAMAAVIIARNGEILVEKGAVGYLNREELSAALLPMVRSNIEMGQIVGGSSSALQFYDGERFDIFVLSIGFHHFICLIYDGQGGVRQFGAVNRYGQRAAKDLTVSLGAGAYMLAQAEVEEPARRRPAAKRQTIEIESLEPLARAEEFTLDEPAEAVEPPPVQPMFQPIEDFDPNIFQSLDSLDISAADDMFDPDKLAEIAAENRRGSKLTSYDEATELGLLP